MSYQSEAQLEAQLIAQLQSQNYMKVDVPDYDSLLSNFKTQFERFNAANLGGKQLSGKEWERVLNYLNGKSIFESAKILRDKFVLEMDDSSKVYVSLMDEDFSKNIFQVTNQTMYLFEKGRLDDTGGLTVKTIMIWCWFYAWP